MSDKKKENTSESTEPKSAHATPIVENYVDDRTEKAEQQIEQEEKDKDQSGTSASSFSSLGFDTGYYAIF